MTNQQANHPHLASMLLVFLLLTSFISSSARPLNDNSFSFAGNDPTFNLALPSNRVETPGRMSAFGHKRVAGKLSFHRTRLAQGKSASLVLNMLPKGPVPPSGPSKGTNNLNN